MKATHRRNKVKIERAKFRNVKVSNEVQLTDEDTVTIITQPNREIKEGRRHKENYKGRMLFITDTEVDNLIGWYSMKEVTKMLRSISPVFAPLKGYPYRMSDSVYENGKQVKLYHTESIKKAVSYLIITDEAAKKLDNYAPTILTN